MTSVAVPQVAGVHQVDGNRPVYLVEIGLNGCEDSFDWSSVTQSDARPDQTRWRAVYDEQAVPDRPGHWCFFFHQRRPRAPLSCSSRELLLPAMSRRSLRLGNSLGPMRIRCLAGSWRVSSTVALDAGQCRRIDAARELHPSTIVPLARRVADNGQRVIQRQFILFRADDSFKPTSCDGAAPLRLTRSCSGS